MSILILKSLILGLIGAGVGCYFVFGFLPNLIDLFYQVRQESRENRRKWAEYHTDRNARIDELCRTKREARLRGEHFVH